MSSAFILTPHRLRPFLLQHPKDHRVSRDLRGKAPNDVDPSLHLSKGGSRRLPVRRCSPWRSGKRLKVRHLDVGAQVFDSVWRLLPDRVTSRLLRAATQGEGSVVYPVPSAIGCHLKHRCTKQRSVSPASASHHVTIRQPVRQALPDGIPQPGSPCTPRSAPESPAAVRDGPATCTWRPPPCCVVAGQSSARQSPSRAWPWPESAPRCR